MAVDTIVPRCAHERGVIAAWRDGTTEEAFIEEFDRGRPATPSRHFAPSRRTGVGEWSGDDPDRGFDTRPAADVPCALVQQKE